MAWALKPETKDHVDVSLALGKIVACCFSKYILKVSGSAAAGPTEIDANANPAMNATAALRVVIAL